MYIAGTRLDRLSGLRDVLDDVTFVPLREAHNTQRYQQALAALEKSKGRIKYLVGHSLGGAATVAMTEQFTELEARIWRPAYALEGQRAGEELPAPVRRHLDARRRSHSLQGAGPQSPHLQRLLRPHCCRASETKVLHR